MNKKDAQRVLEALTNITKHFGISRLHQSTLADTTVRGDAHKAIEIMEAEVADPDDSDINQVHDRNAGLYDLPAKREQALKDVAAVSQKLGLYAYALTAEQIEALTVEKDAFPVNVHLMRADMPLPKGPTQ